eukprot:TRINITY_DN6854_c0_g1_i2.p1 TRINITY_DN6854_c0_g1~~TRINITY_DN6854_c0_g1_i2.p1  ORF type:complete len:873 (-),score=198.61 TRINITY_DN6854_c0_g1_i2:121-2739(-)
MGVGTDSHEGGTLDHVKHHVSDGVNQIKMHLQHLKTPDWLQVPWPDWMPFEEPEWVKTIPGGSVTVSMILVCILALLVLQLFAIAKGFWRCMRKIDAKVPLACLESNGAGAQSADKVLEHCVGPKVVLILQPKYTCRCECFKPLCCCAGLCKHAEIQDEVEKWLSNPRNVEVATVDFGIKSSLYGHKCFAIGMTEDQVKRCAEKQRLRKKVKNHAMKKVMEVVNDDRVHSQQMGSFGSIMGEYKESLLEDNVERKLATWAKYKKDDDDMFESCDLVLHKFTANEVIQTILGELVTAPSSQGYPVFLAAQEAGEIESFFPILHRESDRRNLNKMLHEWKAWKFWKSPPVEKLASTFGPSTALYFVFMHSYAMWLIFPSLLVLSSLLFHAFFSKLGLSLGATFNEGWSQSTFSVILALWSTIFLANWRCSIYTCMHRLGQLTQPNRTSIDNATLFFKQMNFKVSKRSGVTHTLSNKKLTNGASKPKKKSSARNDFCRHLLIAGSVLFLMMISVGVIGILCKFSDVVAQLNYYADPSDWRNLALQNVLSVFVYMLVSIPLQGVYDVIVVWITQNEDHRSQARLTERIVRRRALFQLLNYYCWFLYLGFWTQDWQALRAQLMTFFVVKPSGLGGALIDVLTPRCTKFDDAEVTIAETIEKEHGKNDPEMFEEYLQVALVFGAATFFAPIFPEGIIIAFVHTVCEYCGDKSSLLRHRLSMPTQSQLFGLQGWITVFDGVGWLSIVVSTWLVYVFLEGIGTQEMNTACAGGAVYPTGMILEDNVTCTNSTWDDYVKWDPFYKKGSGEPDVVSTVLNSLFSPGHRTVFVILAVEHMLLGLKAYLALTIPVESSEVQQHEELTQQMLSEYDRIRERERRV